MTPIRSSSRSTLSYVPASFLALALALAGCGQSGPARFASTDSWPDAKRKPDGVAIDPVSAAEPPARRGSTDAVGPIALTPPLSASLAQKAVHAFFDAIVREDLSALATVLTERAIWASPALAGRGATQAIAVWASRFQKLDYRELAAVPLVRDGELEVYGDGDFDGKTPGRPTKPAEMVAGDVLVRARIVTPRIGADRLLGDELVFVLRPTDGRYRIALLFEDFQLPLRAMAQQAGVNPHQCVKCGAPVGTGGGRCPFCGTEQPQAALGADRSQIATVGLTDANRARLGRPSVRVPAPKKSRVGLFLVFGGLAVALVGVTVGGLLVLRSPPPPLPSASAPPPRPRIEPQIVAGVVLTDPNHVDATDVLPLVRKRVIAWEPEAKLLEITVTHAKANGHVNVNEPGSEIVLKYLSEKKDPRAAKGKETTRSRLVFALRPGAADPEIVPGLPTDKGVAEPNCIWGAAYRAALKSGLPDGTIDARYGWVAKADAAAWTFTSNGETREVDGNTCVIHSTK